MNTRFAIAMAVYAVLGILGTISLTGKIRQAVWVFLGFLAIKTVIVVMSRKHEE